MRGWSTICLIGAITLAGCNSCELVEAELRAKSMRLEETEKKLRHREGEIAALEATVDYLRGCAGDPTGSSVPPEALYKSVGLARIDLGRTTGGRDVDRDGKDDGVQIVIAPVDAEGDTLKCPGSATVSLKQIESTGGKLEIGRWAIDGGSLRENWKTSILGAGYQINLPWSMMPTTEKMRLTVVFTTLDGRTFEAEKDFKISLNAAAPVTPALNRTGVDSRADRIADGRQSNSRSLRRSNETLNEVESRRSAESRSGGGRSSVARRMDSIRRDDSDSHLSTSETNDEGNDWTAAKPLSSDERAVDDDRLQPASASAPSDDAVRSRISSVSRVDGATKPDDRSTEPDSSSKRYSSIITPIDVSTPVESFEPSNVSERAIDTDTNGAESPDDVGTFAEVNAWGEPIDKTVGRSTVRTRTTSIVPGARARSTNAAPKLSATETRPSIPIDTSQAGEPAFRQGLFEPAKDPFRRARSVGVDHLPPRVTPPLRGSSHVARNRPAGAEFNSAPMKPKTEDRLIRSDRPAPRE